MNKEERKQKGHTKFLKRLKNYGIDELIFKDGWGNTKRGVKVNFNCYRTTGKPCSCAGCSPGKVEEKAKYRYNKFNKNKIDE
jgi:hypothetical protein